MRVKKRVKEKVLSFMGVLVISIPTPVSALIHAATMVTAGVFLLIRASPLFDVVPLMLIIITTIGGFNGVFCWHNWFGSK